MNSAKIAKFSRLLVFALVMNLFSGCSQVDDLKASGPKNLLHPENGAELEEILKNNDKVFVDFFATWCGPCKQLSPVITELAKDTPEVIFVKFDIDKDTDAARRYGVGSVPTLVLFKNKSAQPIDRKVGLQSKVVLKAWITEKLEGADDTDDEDSDEENN